MGFYLLDTCCTYHMLQSGVITGYLQRYSSGDGNAPSSRKPVLRSVKNSFKYICFENRSAFSEQV